MQPVCLEQVSGDDYTVREGEVGSHVFFLWQGRMRVTHGKRTLRYTVEGSYFGDMAVFITARHLVSFQAHESSSVRPIIRPETIFF
eukprot:SAG11_NODE_367_length_10114_cov_16.930904_3_plen_86_part_00